MSNEEHSKEQLPSIEWFASIKDSRVGPVDITEIEQMMKDGAVTAETLIWHAGMTDWQAAGQIPELKSLCDQHLPQSSSSPPPPPPPPPSSPPPPPPPSPSVSGSFDSSKETLSQVWQQPAALLNKGQKTIATHMAPKHRALRHEFHGITAQQTVTYIIQFANLNGYVIQDVRESEGMLTLKKNRFSFPISCSDTANGGTLVELTLTGILGNDQTAPACFEELKSAVLSLQHGVTLSTSVKQAPVESSFTQGMNQAVGCFVGVLLIWFLLMFFGGFLISL